MDLKQLSESVQQQSTAVPLISPKRQIRSRFQLNLDKTIESCKAQLGNAFGLLSLSLLSSSSSLGMPPRCNQSWILAALNLALFIPLKCISTQGSVFQIC